MIYDNDNDTSGSNFKTYPIYHSLQFFVSSNCYSISFFIFICTEINMINYLSSTWNLYKSNGTCIIIILYTSHNSCFSSFQRIKCNWIQNNKQAKTYKAYSVKYWKLTVKCSSCCMRHYLGYCFLLKITMRYMKSVFNIHNPNYGSFNSNVPLPPCIMTYLNCYVVVTLWASEEAYSSLGSIKSGWPQCLPSMRSRFKSLTTSRIFSS